MLSPIPQRERLLGSLCLWCVVGPVVAIYFLVRWLMG